MAPIRKGPFYAVEIRPAILCWTGTGLRINADTAVMNKADKPIRGLYAAGETVGNLHGDVYIGGGGSYGPCMVFGKLAGDGRLNGRGQVSAVVIIVEFERRAGGCGLKAGE